MKPLTLARFLARQSAAANLLQAFSTGFGSPLCIQDPQGAILFGELPAGPLEKHAIEQDGTLLGWVLSQKGGQPAAQLVAHLFSQEVERKALAGEVLDRYRELNLLYNLSENLVASPQPESISALILAQAGRLIQAVGSRVVLLNGSGRDYQVVSASGESDPLMPAGRLAILDEVLQTGRAQLVNDVLAGQGTAGEDPRSYSLLCAPLKTDRRVLGAVLLFVAAPAQYTAGDLRLLNAITLQAAPAIEIARLYQVAVEKARLERELQMARQVQASLLPSTIPYIQGWEFAARWLPARQVSGDYYDFIEQEHGQLGLVMADVADKGMPASLLMVFARSAVRASLDRTASPQAALSRANRLLCQEAPHGPFVTLFYARLDSLTGQLTYVNAGHNPPLHYQSAGQQLQLLKRTGIPLGIEPDSAYGQATVQLHQGDFILFYTDGATEAADPDQEEFGLARLQQFLLDHCQAPADQVLAALEGALDRFTGSAPPADDITLMFVRRIQI